MRFAGCIGCCLVTVACGRIDFDPVPTPPARPRIVVVEKQYPNGGRWTDFVRADGEPCDVVADGLDGKLYGDCVHGGERLAVRVATETSCDQLAARDDLDVFTWVCDVTPDGIVFRSRLRPGRGLADLVDASSWIANRVTIVRDTTVAYESVADTWWDNPIIEPPNNAATSLVKLEEPYAIYVVPSSRSTAGYFLGASHVAFVTLAGAALSFEGPINCSRGTGYPLESIDSRCTLFSQLLEYQWVEGHFDGGDVADTNLLFAYSLLTTVRNTRVEHARSHGMQLEGAAATLVDTLVAVHNGAAGLRDHYSHTSTFHDITASYNGEDGVYAYDGGPWRMTELRTIGNARDGLHFQFDALGTVVDLLTVGNGGDGLNWTSVDLSPSTIQRVVAANNTGNGVRTGSLFDDSLSHLVALNNGGTNLMLDGTSDANNLFAQLVLAGAGTGELQSINMTDTTFAENFLVDDATTSGCSATGGTNPGISSTCTSSANLVAGVDVRSAFVGSQPSTVSADATDVADDPLVVWGRDSAQFDTAAIGRCTTGQTCRAWSFHLSQSSVLRDAARTGTPLAEPLVPGAACPTGVTGDRVIRSPDQTCSFPNWSGSCMRVFLVDAIELLDDDIGNEDGLCESNETCVYAPSFGLDQGDAPLIGPCLFQDGAVSGVTMYGR